mgnify:CR=1 FL=1|tara:strand:+ start:362 stop:610 length:249 start_codon:yes stop_codon:yes gene_type:complete
MLELYQRVALREDLPNDKLQQGDIATLVDFIPHPHNGERGCVLEVFNAIGESLKVVVVQESQIEPLTPDELLTVRRIKATTL